MEELKEMLCSEIDEISERGQLGVRDVEMLYKLTEILKNIDKIMPMDDYSRDDGKEEMLKKMEKMMHSASGEEREPIRRAMEELRDA